MSKTGSKNAAAARRARRSGSGATASDGTFHPGTVPDLPRSTGFFLDVDGTLLDIADHPRLAQVDDDLGGLLSALRGAAGGALALISGRSVAEIDRLFASSGFCVAGQHGAERRDFSGTMHRHAVPLAGLREAGERLRRLVAEHPALVLEDKGMNLALHYRRAPALGAAVRDAIGQLVGELGDEFEMQAGKMVFEIKPSGRDKGVAIGEFLEEAPFRGRVPVFIGDDLTDEFGFELINRVGGHSVKVGEGGSAARWRLPNANAVRAWLARFVARHRENT
jgi:trehalose 6-phosphate phosphatase